MRTPLSSSTTCWKRGLQQRAEIGDVREVALAAEQQPADFVLELLDGAAQRRLGDVALLRGPREVAGLADRQEIPDVMNVHGPSEPCELRVRARVLHQCA